MSTVFRLHSKRRIRIRNRKQIIMLFIFFFSCFSTLWYLNKLKSEKVVLMLFFRNKIFGALVFVRHDTHESFINLRMTAPTAGWVHMFLGIRMQITNEWGQFFFFLWSANVNVIATRIRLEKRKQKKSPCTEAHVLSCLDLSP